MARLSDETEYGVLERVFSPDRRLAIDFRRYPDPRSDYEMNAPESAVLRDAETGAELAVFGAWAMVLHHEWPAEGGLLLTLPHDRRVAIAPDWASFRPDDGPAQPIAALQDWVLTLAPPPWPKVPPLPPRARAGWAAVVILAVALVAGALFAVLG
jgi:hypothetical protein